MSDLFLLAPASVPRAAENPLPTVPATPGERFDLELQAGLLAGNSNSEGRARFEAFAEAARVFEDVGIQVRNPYARDNQDDLARLDAVAHRAMAGGAVPEQRDRRAELLGAWNEAAERARAQHPDRAHQFRDAADVDEAMAVRVRRAVNAARMAEEVGTGALGFTAGLAGGAIAAFADPLQLATLPIGAPTRLGGMLATRILQTAVIEAGVAGVTQAGVELVAAPFRESIGLEARPGENILAAAAGGAVLGGGLRGLIEGFYIARGGENPLARPIGPPAGISQAEADALGLSMAHLRAREGNPGGPERAAQHLDAQDQAAQDVASGRAPRAMVPAPEQPPPAVLRLATLTPDEVRAHAEQALADVAATQRPRPDVAWREDIGGISAPWGSAGDAAASFRGGTGLARILAERAAAGDTAEAVLRDILPRVLTDGRVVALTEFRLGRQDSARVVLERDGWQAGLVQSGATWELRSLIRAAAPGVPAPTPDAPVARRINVFTPPGRSILVEPRAVELGSLIPSHLEDGRLNPAYPHAEGVQPRDRSAAPSLDQVRNIAAGLIPERLAPNAEAGLGAPIVADDLVVESGNGRVMALRQIFRDPALAEQRDRYLAFLRSRGEAVDGLREPVLVSSRVSALSPAERRAFVAEANGRTTAAQSLPERARADADIVARHVRLLQPGDLRSEANAPFVRAFLDGLTPEDRADLIKADGQIAAAGIRRMQEAITARAFGDELGPMLGRMLDDTAPGMRAIAGGLTDNAARWARMRVAVEQGRTDAAADVTADLIAAIRAIESARARRITIRGLLLQQDFDAPDLTDTARALLHTFLRDPQASDDILPRAAITARLRGYLDGFAERQPGPDMFGAAPTAADMLRNTRGEADATLPEGALAEGVPDTLPPADADAGRRAAILATADADAAARAPAPQAEAAELLEARRIAAEQDVQVPVAREGEDAADAAAPDAPTIGARQLLDDADDAVTAAAEAAACMIGGAT